MKINADKILFSLVMVFAGLPIQACCNYKSILQTQKAVLMIKTDTVKIKITIGGKTVTAILYDNPTSKDFAAQLPLTLKMEDYNKTEKISMLTQKLSSKNAPSGMRPVSGDITYYEPWGNLALFYKGFGYSNGLIAMGKITSCLEIFEVSGTITASFEVLQ